MGTVWIPGRPPVRVYGSKPLDKWRRRIWTKDLDEGSGGWLMTVVEGLLLAVSVVVFIYLGIAMFMPERL
jgi:hypothetical protein